MQAEGSSTIEPSEVPVVGIGYSAGGLEAVRDLLAKLSPDTGMAFVVIQHIQRDQESHLPEILQKETDMQVRAIQSGLRVESNTVYVIPPGCDVVLSGDFLNLNPRGESNVHLLGIDFFFASLSQSRKTKAIGIVLSGTGSDGTLGLKAIKSEGGITIVQDPRSAKFDGMPRSAIASGLADLILAPEAIAAELERLAKHPYTRATLHVPPDIPPEGSPASSAHAAETTTLGQILDLLLDHTKVDFSLYKPSTIRRRIERQMMIRKIETIDKYAEYLKKNPDEVSALYEDIFIHVTDFFRDPETFDALRQRVFPELIKGKSKDLPLRVWVPGCATGEEVYSLAISLTEYLQEKSLNFPLHLFATDISEPALQRARKGTYADYQMRSLSDERLERFFEKVKGGYKVSKQIRDLCIFSRHDVTANPPIPRVDLISCRNVLIYFSVELQKRLFPVFHYALNPNGFLWLGRAENPEAASKLFEPVDKSHKIFAKTKGFQPAQPRFSAPSYTGMGRELVVPPSFSTMAAPVAGEITRNADQVILFRYSPPSVVVDSDLNILQFRGRTVPYLEPSPGTASYSLLKMVNPDIAAPLRVCLQAAKRQNSPARKEEIEFQFEGKLRKTHIDVSPLNPTASPKERQYLVIFEDASTPRQPKTKAKALSKQARASKASQDQTETLSQYNTQLQQELDAAREYQQSLIEEYESSQEELTSANEELRSTNEELQSTNEELHSTNEELGSAKEELQAANEELQSTNEEIQKRNIELESALANLERSEQRFRLMIGSVRDYAIFMLDPGGFVATWNEGAKRIKGYEADEIIGEHFSRFYPPEDKDEKPKMELREATKLGRFEDEGWRLRKDGSRFWANVVITAVRDQHRSLLGFVKVTRDLTERKRAEEELKASREKFERMARTFDTALSSSPDFHYTFDTSQRFTYVNQALLKLLGKTLDEVVGKNFADLGYPPELVKLHETQLNQVLKGQAVRGENSFTNFEGNEGYYEYVFVPILDETGRVQAISGTTRDVTERKRLERERLLQQRRELEHKQLKQSEEQFRMLANSLSQLAWMANADGYITWYNHRWYEYTGTSPQDMEGWGWQRVHDPDHLPMVLDRWKTALAQEVPFDMEFPLRAANGQFRWFLTRVEPVRDENGKLIRWFGTNTDIDDLRRTRFSNELLARASAILSESLELGQILQSLADLLVGEIADWCIVAIDTPDGAPDIAAVAHPDKTELERVRSYLRDNPAPGDSPSRIAQVIRTGRPEIIEEVSESYLRQQARSDAHLELLLELKPRSALLVPLIARGKAVGTLALVSSSPNRRYGDSDLLLTEELGRRAGVAIDNALLYQDSRRAISTRDEFLSIASHELKTPLTSLQIQAQLRERSAVKENAEAFTFEKLRKMFETDRKQIERLTRLIDDMLDVTRIASNKLALRLEKTDLSDVLEDVLERLSSQFAASGCEVRLEKHEHAVGLFDRFRIEQVIVNLLTNALRYGDGKPVHVSLVHRGDRLRLSVRDEGIGIAKADQARIFRQYERATRTSVSTGLGLGLYISQQIVEAHGGTIHLESERGQGSTFTVELPLKDQIS